MASKALNLIILLLNSVVGATRIARRHCVCLYSYRNMNCIYRTPVLNGNTVGSDKLFYHQVYRLLELYIIRYVQLMLLITQIKNYESCSTFLPTKVPMVVPT